MNKTEFVERVAETAQVTKKDAKAMVENFILTLTDVMSEGDNVNLTPFGKFEVVERAAREGRNPQTGEAMSIPAKNAVKFKPSKGLKELVNS